MSEWLDKKYINLLSSSLKNFKWKDGNIARCSCPICGDSKRSKVKARFYFIADKTNYFIHCHNCGISLPFSKFLCDIDPQLYHEYNVELVMDRYKQEPPKEEQPLNFVKPSFLKKDSILRDLKKISQLSADHPAKKYVMNRKIPTEKHYKLFYAPKFNQWTNTIIPNKLPKDYDEPRLVIPFLDRNQDVFGYQGRSFSKKGIRYITIMIDEDKPKIFGLDTINTKKPYFVLEGPLDSLFVPNSVAMAGSDLNLEWCSNAIFIFDNEPRNKEIVHKMQKIINLEHKIVIWPEEVKEKDINDMVISGRSQEDVLDIINDNVYNGLTANLKFMQWKRSQ